ncbi:MAG TPA: DUF6314 family protein [Rhodopseudomonas sp.]|uniref:DUF6314 family protein n=1 Tax=Rhodopseudomonas sp. TaxID=1078 RepID=UPI002ED80DD1
MSEILGKSRWEKPEEVFGNLVGKWSLDRTIEGHGSMQGAATFTPIDQDNLAYREEGIFKLLDGTELPAEQEYIFRVREGGFDVLFKENPPRLFLEISLAQDDSSKYLGCASHLCGRDTYQSTYTFLPNGDFVIRYVVGGPRKDYTMLTTYSRA